MWSQVSQDIPLLARAPAHEVPSRRYCVCPATSPLTSDASYRRRNPPISVTSPSGATSPNDCSPVAWSVLEKTTRSPGRNPTGCATSSPIGVRVGSLPSEGALTRTDWPSSTSTHANRLESPFRTNAGPALTLLTTSKSLVSSTIWLPVGA